jgi:hypothetical protein
MKLAFETKGFLFQADDTGVSLDAKAGDTMFSANATWGEIHDTYAEVKSRTPDKARRLKRERPAEVV